MKTCSKCGVEKPVSDFNKHKSRRDGLRDACRACHGLDTKAYRLAHPEKVAATQAAHYALNKDAVAVRGREYRAANRERIAVRDAAYASANHEKLAAYKREYALANAAKIAAYAAEYYVLNVEKIRASVSAYRRANPEKRATWAAGHRARHPEAARTRCQNRRARKQAAGGRLPRDIEQRLLARQNGLCACCFADLSETGYHLDHIVALAKGGSHTEGNVQLLTPRCNREKGTKDWIEYLNSRPRIQAATVAYRRAS